MVAGHRVALLLGALAMGSAGSVVVVDGRSPRPGRGPNEVDSVDDPDGTKSVVYDDYDVRIADVDLTPAFSLEDYRPEVLDYGGREAYHRTSYANEPKPRAPRPWTPDLDRQMSAAQAKRLRKQARRLSEGRS